MYGRNIITSKSAKSTSTPLPQLSLLSARNLFLASGLFAVSLMASLINSGINSTSQQRPVNELTLSKPTVNVLSTSSNTGQEAAVAPPLLTQGADMSTSQTETSISSTGNGVEVVVNGETKQVPTDGSTITESLISGDGATSTVISVSGNSNSSASVSVDSSTRSSSSTNESDARSNSP